MKFSWHIVTPEYPPEPGGVSDFSRILAGELAKRDIDIEVWHPDSGCPPAITGVRSHLVLGDFGPRALARLDRGLGSFPAPRRLLVQWVPHGYGWKAMNLPFCWWLYRRMRRGDIIDLMVHEPCVMFAGRIRHYFMAGVQRTMAAILLRSATRVWCAIPMWETVLKGYARRNTEFKRMPVFCTVPHADNSLTPAVPEFDFGHFSSFGTSTALPLKSVLPALFKARPDATALMIGQGSIPFREQVVATNPGLAPRIQASGPLTPGDIATQLKRCGTLLQPVRGGVSGRNTSVLAGLANGLPTVTTSGWLTEPMWAESGAVAIVPESDDRAFVEAAIGLANRPEERLRMGRVARDFYHRTFDSHLLTEALIRS